MMFLLLMTAIAAAPSTENPRTVTVSGEANVKVVPDQVVITLGVESFETKLELAAKDNDDRVKKVLAAARAAGVAERDLATDAISVEPRYASGSVGDRVKIVGYTARKTLVVTLRSVAGFEPLLASVLEAGANYIHGVQFQTSELRKHRDRARALAIQAAKEKAAALAGELGEKLGRVRTISEGGGGWWSSYGFWGSRYSSMSQNVVQQASGSPEPGETVAPGTISVTASVSVTFDLG